jgi:nucleoside-diphosphate-sugar epimerase
VSRVLVTGATGFIGPQVLGPLVDAGHEVHALTRRGGQSLAGVTWHTCDLLDGCQVVGDVGADVLVHLAWGTERGSLWSSPDNVRWVEASLALLRSFVTAGGRRAVMAGSCAEYDWARHRETYPEDSPLRPGTLYGAAKHGLHTVAAALAEASGVSLVWARLFFLYGPREDPERFVASIVRSLLAGERAPMTLGIQRRDYMHVADVGAALAALVDSPLSGPLNVASGEGAALMDVARLIAGLTGGGERLAPGAIPMPADDPSSLVADVGRLHGELGFRARFTLDTGLEDTVSWWRAQ